jgi:hypothetical protein
MSRALSLTLTCDACGVSETKTGTIDDLALTHQPPWQRYGAKDVCAKCEVTYDRWRREQRAAGKRTAGIFDWANKVKEGRP